MFVVFLIATKEREEYVGSCSDRKSVLLLVVNVNSVERAVFPLKVSQGTLLFHSAIQF